MNRSILYVQNSDNRIDAWITVWDKNNNARRFWFDRITRASQHRISNLTYRPGIDVRVVCLQPNRTTLAIETRR